MAAYLRAGVRDILRVLGLHGCPPFYRDVRFVLALLAAGGFWLGLWLWVPVQPLDLRQVAWWHLAALAVWQPLLEEVLFRGFLQGEMGRYAWGQRALYGVTLANAVTSCLFMLGHWLFHPPLWATAVLLPSLIFGYFRDRYASLYPSITLHMIYNTGYFLLTGLPR